MTETTASPPEVLPVSVVIATLGGDVLTNTIRLLNQGEGIPTEILICIPEEMADKAGGVASEHNVRIVPTSCRGQVAQRAVGLAEALCPYVMQFDDDVIMSPDSLKVMVETLKSKGPGNIVAPFFQLQSSGADGTSYVGGLKSILRNCHASLVCGAPFGRERFGKISPAGISFGVLRSQNIGRVIESEWLPGGVALCHKDDVITENYYPFPGKAFSEDLIHSLLWRRAGCRFWTVGDISAAIDVTVESFDWNSVMGRYRAHAYVAKMISGKSWRTRLWFLFYCLANMHRLIAQNMPMPLDRSGSRDH